MTASETSAAGGPSWVLDVDEANFAKEAIDRSVDMPVVVDFWAPWCGPCRQLGPVLEKLAAEYDGQFMLVKADTEKLPNVAAQFGVQSIPYVVALRNRQIVNEFLGAMGEKEIRQWLTTILPSPAETLVAEAKALEAGDRAAATAKYREALQAAPQDAAAKIGLARVLLEEGQAAESRKLIDELLERGYLEPEAESVQAGLLLRERGADVADVATCRAAVAKSPDDLAAVWQLAQALAAGQQWEEAMQLCLRLVREDRKGVGEQARAAIVDIFHLLGNDSELATDYRRKLSSALY
ncbi:MAG: tetratricopeptide repeat protein [Pirellulales bacterium]